MTYHDAPIAAISLTGLGNAVAVVIVGAALLWIILAAFTAEYGRQKGFPWFPLFASAVFVGWPLVLLAVTVGAGPRARRA